ncbi:MAG TPA: class I SAM-dependent methyltransferase [Chloroflexota bacterium]|nr:class I SAM-dependent methyltransferase [Chloroflexota bacterium]
MDEGAAWTEDSSARFIELGAIYAPFREDIAGAVLGLIPAETDEGFLAVELGTGTGWLSAAILERFPRARVLGLDGSPAMLRMTAETLGRYSDRVDLQRFRLEDPDRLASLAGRARCVVSSLVIHHLDGTGKRALYREVRERLEPGGALLIADIVAPASERERRYVAERYDGMVRRRSLAVNGNLEAYRRFLDDEWNWFRYPDPMDKPSTIPEHLRWLQEAGLTGVNVFWQRAGHAVYGGYAPL